MLSSARKDYYTKVVLKWCSLSVEYPNYNFASPIEKRKRREGMVFF
jgi:hypothetical protein